MQPSKCGSLMQQHRPFSHWYDSLISSASTCLDILYIAIDVSLADVNEPSNVVVLVPPGRQCNLHVKLQLAAAMCHFLCNLIVSLLH